MEKKLLEYLKWLMTGEVGKSSKAILSKMLGIKSYYENAPIDPSDFRRCLLLLEEFPEFRDRLPEMKSVSPSWDLLINRWDEVEASFVSEVPEWKEGMFNWAGKTYKLMKEIGL